MITNPNQVEHLGATRATNNTGELSAVCHALTGARELARPGEEVLILSDSQISRSAPRARAARLLDWRILGVAQCLLQVILCQDRSHQLRCWLLHLPPALGGKNPMMLDLQYNKCCEYFTSCRADWFIGAGADSVL